MYSETSSYYSSSDSEIIENNEEQWQELVVDKDYEINTNNLYEIRRKGTNKKIKLTLDSKGYYVCSLNRKTFKHHRVVAIQFIPNPEGKPDIDHMNHVRNDNNISNLRWVSHYENMQNTGGYAGKSFVFTEEIDKECMEIKRYGNRTLEGYYYDFNQDIFYHREFDGKYRILNVFRYKDGRRFVKMYDNNHVRFDFCVKKFLADL